MDSKTRNRRKMHYKGRESSCQSHCSRRGEILAIPSVILLTINCAAAIPVASLPQLIKSSNTSIRPLDLKTVSVEYY